MATDRHPLKPVEQSTGQHFEHAIDQSLRREVSAQRTRQGFSLGALFLLFTVCGVFAAYAMPLGDLIRKNQRSFEDYALSAVIASLVSTLVGGIVGGMQRRPLVGIMLGLPIGAVIGLIVGPLALVPIDSFPSFLRTSLIGSVAVIVVAAIFRRL